MRRAHSRCQASPLLFIFFNFKFFPNFIFNSFFNGGFILVSDYVRMEVTQIGASWDVVAGVQTGCGLHSYMKFLWSTELPCARGTGALSGGARAVGSPIASAWFPVQVARCPVGLLYADTRRPVSYTHLTLPTRNCV